jgi:hypothetical protein
MSGWSTSSGIASGKQYQPKRDLFPWEAWHACLLMEHDTRAGCLFQGLLHWCNAASDMTGDGVRRLCLMSDVVRQFVYLHRLGIPGEDQTDRSPTPRGRCGRC